MAQEDFLSKQGSCTAFCVANGQPGKCSGYKNQWLFHSLIILGWGSTLDSRQFTFDIGQKIGGSFLGHVRDF